MSAPAEIISTKKPGEKCDERQHSEDTLGIPSLEKEDNHVPESPSPGRAPRLWKFFVVSALILAVGFFGGLLPRVGGRTTTAADTRALASPSVAVISPVPAKAAPSLVLSGELRPEVEAPIHARVNGYVRKWNVDLGAHVESGQLLAELDTPDTDRELSRARAELAQAEAARDLAGTTARRWKEMHAASTVSAQEADEKAADFELKKATVEAARASVQRLEQVAGFAKIIAPFAGTITVRNLDIGQLITAGGTQELFRLAQTAKLRVFVRVPQGYARSTKVGQSAKLTLPELKGKAFDAKVVRTAGALDAASRTLLTELEVDNSDGEILAGSYAQVRLADLNPEAALTIPANAVMFRSSGPQIAVVHDQTIHLKRVTLGRDFGSAVEIVEGVIPSDRIVTNPSDALTEGAVVRVVGPTIDKPSGQ